ncbi:Uncharacterised protein [Staphylococcus aureus]|nr:Uncharacterised protein [Staphylococcus aureus]
MARITKETKTVSDGYSREDRETTLNYDYENQEWIAYSSVPTHITRMTKLYGDDVEVLERLESGTAVLERLESGTAVLVRAKLPKSAIGFRKLMSEERRQELSERAKRAFGH